MKILARALSALALSAALSGAALAETPHEMHRHYVRVVHHYYYHHHYHHHVAAVAVSGEH